MALEKFREEESSCEQSQSTINGNQPQHSSVMHRSVANLANPNIKHQEKLSKLESNMQNKSTDGFDGWNNDYGSMSNNSYPLLDPSENHHSGHWTDTFDNHDEIFKTQKKKQFPKGEIMVETHNLRKRNVDGAPSDTESSDITQPYSAQPAQTGFIRSFVGSFEESILCGRMATPPSKPIDFLCQIGVFATEKTKKSLRCPPHVLIPFSAIFYDLNNNKSQTFNRVSTPPPSADSAHSIWRNRNLRSESQCPGFRSHRCSRASSLRNSQVLSDGNETVSSIVKPTAVRPRSISELSKHSPTNKFCSPEIIMEIDDSDSVACLPRYSPVLSKTRDGPLRRRNSTGESLTYPNLEDFKPRFDKNNPSYPNAPIEPNATPYVGTVDMDWGLGPLNGYGYLHSSFPPGALIASKTRGKSKDPRGSYRIPPKGQIQLLVKSPNRSVVRIFLVPYDLRDVHAEKAYIRQKYYEKLDSIPVARSETAPGSTIPRQKNFKANNDKKRRLKHAIQLQFHIVKPKEKNATNHHHHEATGINESEISARMDAKIINQSIEDSDSSSMNGGIRYLDNSCIYSQNNELNRNPNQKRRKREPRYFLSHSIRIVFSPAPPEEKYDIVTEGPVFKAA